MSPKNIEHMTSHHSQDVVDGVRVHIFYGEACKQFNKVYPQFLNGTTKHICLFIYIQIQSIRVICCTIFLLTSDTLSL